MNLFDAVFTPDFASRTAVLYEGQEISYAALRDETVRTAGVLHASGVKPGDRIAILLHDSPGFITSFLSVCSLGAIAVPVNRALGLDEQRTILSDCAARTMILEPDLCNILLPRVTGRLPSIEDVLILSRGEEFEVPKLSGVKCQVLSEAVRRPIDGPFPVPPDSDAPAFILYTSGSTGDPKGAVHRQADIFYTNETFCKEVLCLKSGDRLFSSSRLPFAYGLGNSLSFPLLNGVTTILCREKPTPAVINQVFSQERPTIFFGVPVVYNLLLQHHRQGGSLDCSSLRLCISAGEALPALIGEEWQRTFGVEVLDAIGSTEMLHMFMSNHEGEVCYGSSGKVLAGYEARLLDDEGNATPASEVGNLWTKGASAAMGYWQRPEATERTFVDGWVRTGDLYRCDADGYYFHMGRSDDCFKSSGQWVSPVEVEGVLLRHGGVSHTAVVEGFDEHGLPGACAFIVRKGLESDTVELEKELRELMRDALPRFKQPRKYVFVSELPYTVTGKVQRFKLREQLRKVESPVSSA